MRGFAIFRRAALGLVLALSPATAPVGAQSAPGYTVGPKDVLEFSVVEVPSLAVTVTVNEGGGVLLPLIGELRVADMTTAEVADSLRALLEERYVQRATVSVTVREYRSRAVVVTGAVQTPGSQGITGHLTLLEAIIGAGSLQASHGGVVQVLRRSPNGLRDQIEISVEDLFERADPTVNIPLQADDLISVPGTTSVTVYILGEVGTPGPITFSGRERPTLLAALARAGGLSDRAADKIRIKRAHSGPGRESPVLEVDYKQLVRARTADVELDEGDVIIVKRSIF